MTTLDRSPLNETIPFAMSSPEKPSSPFTDGAEPLIEPSIEHAVREKGIK
jgi:hypothetical protein